MTNAVRLAALGLCVVACLSHRTPSEGTTGPTKQSSDITQSPESPKSLGRCSDTRHRLVGQTDAALASVSLELSAWVDFPDIQRILCEPSGPECLMHLIGLAPDSPWPNTEVAMQHCSATQVVRFHAAVCRRVTSATESTDWSPEIERSFLGCLKRIQPAYAATFPGGAVPGHLRADRFYLADGGDRPH